MWYCPKCNEFKREYDVVEKVTQSVKAVMNKFDDEELGEVEEYVKSEVVNRYCQECEEILMWGVITEDGKVLYTNEQLEQIFNIMDEQGLSKMENTNPLVCQILI